jgi:two-component system phosphate regulon sensor histidine kinase PhoR
VAEASVNIMPELDILDGIPDPVILLDDRRRVVRLNLAAQHFFDGEYLGRDLAFVVRHPNVLDAADAALAGARGQREDVTIARDVPRQFTVHVSQVRLGADNKKKGAMLVMHDVTAARNAEEMRADFVANVSHELRSPLSSLVGFIETLRGAARDDPDARARFLAIMESEALRMTRLIGDLLSLSRVEADEHIPPEDYVKLSDLLGSVVDSLSVRAAERKMKIDLTVEPGLPAVIGEQDELAMVFQNLIANAISYAREGTTITVTANKIQRIPNSGDPGIAVCVADVGEGIAAEQIPRLTERFYRVDKGRSRSMGGTGLGLAIVKHIVSRHRGRLAIESRLGEGSRFTVYLPRDTESSVS